MRDYIKVPLDLPEFRVLRQEEDQEGRVIITYVEARQRAKRCPHCGKGTAHQVAERERTVKDLPALGYQVMLKVRQRRLRCKGCQRRFWESFESVDVYQRQSRRYQGWLLGGVRGRSVKEGAKQAGESERVVRHLLDKVGRQEEGKRQRLPKRIGVDEFSRRRGHQYCTVIVALGLGYIFDVGKDRSKESLVRLLTAPGRCGGRVKVAVIDMWEAFYQALQECCGRALIGIDRYHVERHLSEAVSGCLRRVWKRLKRKKEVKEWGLTYKEAQRLVQTPPQQLSQEEVERRRALVGLDEELQRCVHLAERLHRWYSKEMSRQQADGQLRYWLRCLVASGIAELVEFAEMVRRWRVEILNHFVGGETNGMTEGFNNKVKTIKRVTYGRMTYEHFRLRLLWECGPT